jgi:hypothetical protein
MLEQLEQAVAQETEKEHAEDEPPKGTTRTPKSADRR